MISDASQGPARFSRWDKQPVVSSLFPSLALTFIEVVGGRERRGERQESTLLGLLFFSSSHFSCAHTFLNAPAGKAAFRHSLLGMRPVWKRCNNGGMSNVTVSFLLNERGRGRSDEDDSV